MEMEKLVTMNLPLWWVIKDLHKSIAEPIAIKFKLYLSCKTLMIRSDGSTCQILLFFSLESSKYIWKFIDKWICFIHFLGNLNNWKQVFVAIAKCPHLWKKITPGLSGVWDQNWVNSALYIVFWSVEHTDFKNVIVENIPPALSEDAEVAKVKRPRNSKRRKFYYEKW